MWGLPVPSPHRWRIVQAGQHERFAIWAGAIVKASFPEGRQYRIGAVAKLLGEPTHVIRFWQKQFGVRDERSKKRQRVFSEATVCKLLLIQALLRVELYTISGAKLRLSSVNR